MAKYKAQHARPQTKGYMVPKAAATLAITAGLAVSPLLQTAAIAQGNTCEDNCKTGTQQTWDACKQAVVDAKAALEKAQTAADDAAAKVEAAKEAQAKALQLKEDLTNAYSEAEAAYKALDGDAAIEKLDNAKATMDEAEANKKAAEQDYTNAQMALREAQIMKAGADKAVVEADDALTEAIAKTNLLAGEANNLGLELNDAKRDQLAAQETVSKAEVKVTDAQAKVDEATAELQAAQKAENDAKAALDQAAADKAEAQAAYDKAAAWKAECAQNLTTARQSLEDAESYLADANKALEDAQGKYDEAKAYYGKVKAFWEQVTSDAKADLNAALKNLDSVKAGEADAQKDLAAKIADAKDYESNKPAYTFRLNELNTKLEAAKKDTAEKAETLKQLQGALDQQYEGVKAAQDAATKAFEDYDNAKNQVAEVQKQLDEAKAEAAKLESYQNDKAVATDKYNNAYLAYVDALTQGITDQDYLNMLRDQFKSADEELQAANANIEKAEQAAGQIDMLQQFVEQAQKSVDEYGADYQKAQANADELNARYTEAQKVVDEAKAASDAAAETEQGWADRYNALFAEIQHGAELLANLDTYEAQLAASKAKVQAAQDAYNEAKSNYDKQWADAKDGLGAAATDLNNAQTVLTGAKDVAAHGENLVADAQADVKANEEAYIRGSEAELAAYNVNFKAGQALKDAEGANAAAYSRLQLAYARRAMFNRDLMGAQQDLEKAKEGLAAIDEQVELLGYKYAYAREQAAKAQAAETAAWADLALKESVAADAATALEQAEATEASAKKTRDDLVDFYLQAQAEYTKVRSDAAAAIIKAEAVFEHVNGYFVAAVQSGVKASDVQFYQPDSSDLAGRVSLLTAKLGWYEEVIYGCGMLVTETAEATKAAEAELATANENLAAAQNAYTVAAACYDSCEEKGYHKAAAKEEKADKKDEKLAQTGDTANAVVTVVAAAGVASLAGAEVLRRRAE